MQILKNIIVIIIGLQIIGLLSVLGVLMVQEMELRDMEIQQWIEIESVDLDD
jgi:hypothetical protein